MLNVSSSSKFKALNVNYIGKYYIVPFPLNVNKLSPR